MTQHHYKSDFSLKLGTIHGHRLRWMDEAWHARFWTSVKSRCVEFDHTEGDRGGCDIRRENGYIVFYFNNHGLPPGRLNMEMTIRHPDDKYADGYRDEVINAVTDIELTQACEVCTCADPQPVVMYKGMMPITAEEGSIYENTGWIKVKGSKSVDISCIEDSLIDENRMRVYRAGEAVGFCYSNRCVCIRGKQNFITWESDKIFHATFIRCTNHHLPYYSYYCKHKAIRIRIKKICDKLQKVNGKIVPYYGPAEIKIEKPFIKHGSFSIKDLAQGIDGPAIGNVKYQRLRRLTKHARKAAREKYEWAALERVPIEWGKVAKITLRVCAVDPGKGHRKSDWTYITFLKNGHFYETKSPHRDTPCTKTM